MGFSAFLKTVAGAGLLVAEAALHGLALGTSSIAGLVMVISGAITMAHGASLANLLSERWFASAFDAAEFGVDRAG